MDEEIKKTIYKSYLITVHPNNTDKSGKYRVYGRNFLGQTDPPQDAIKLTTYNKFGDDPDELINKVKAEMDQKIKRNKI